MLRFAFNAMTLLSVLLFIFAAAFWVRGQFACDSVDWRTSIEFRSVGVSSSGIAFFGMFADEKARAAFAPAEASWTFRSEPSLHYQTWVADGEDMSQGFQSAQIDYLHVALLVRPLRRIFPPGAGTVVVIHVPFWLLLLLCAVLPATWLIRRPQSPHRRRRLGLCVHCGYDLRGADARCPECGLPSGYATSPAQQAATSP